MITNGKMAGIGDQLLNSKRCKFIVVDLFVCPSVEKSDFLKRIFIDETSEIKRY